MCCDKKRNAMTGKDTLNQRSDLLLMLRSLWLHLRAGRRAQYLVLLILMLAATCAEVLSLGAVLPFLGILVSPEQVFINPMLQGLIGLLRIQNPSDLVLPLTLLFVLLALLAGACRLFLLWFSTRLAFATGADISLEVYRNTLYLPYQVHVQRNTSEVVSGLIYKVNNVVFWIILPLVTLISSAVLLLALTLALVVIDPVVAIAATLGFGLCYATISLLTRKRLRANGECINEEQTRVIKALQEGLGGIRDVILDGSQRFYCSLYREADQKLRKAYGDNNFIAGCPRPTMEALGMVVIAALAYVLGQQRGGISEALPVLGALALGAQRLLPALQQAYGSWATIMGGQAVLAEVVESMDRKPAIDSTRENILECDFKKQISLNNISFSYSNNGNYVLKNINIKIKKGERIGFVGGTGSGKSTILDILMGLLVPTQGKLCVDGLEIGTNDLKAWQKNIAHVPQFIYLADSTLAENIAFGIRREEIDMARVQEAAVKAQISQFVNDHPDGYNARVGERGIRLSGGQRQRIGIARAFYKRAKLLVLDEATSALDNATEQDVMNSIVGFDRDLTIIIVAHRLSTVRHCDVIYELDGGQVVAAGTYDELLLESETFRRMVGIA